eukprot:scaffold53196_cov28-Tisochrysis_lutea.AAC.6
MRALCCLINSVLSSILSCASLRISCRSRRYRSCACSSISLYIFFSSWARSLAFANSSILCDASDGRGRGKVRSCMAGAIGVRDAWGAHSHRPVAYVAGFEGVKGVVVLRDLFLKADIETFECSILLAKVGNLKRLMLHHLAHLFYLVCLARKPLGNITRFARAHLTRIRAHREPALELALLSLGPLPRFGLSRELLPEPLAVFGYQRQHRARLLHRRHCLGTTPHAQQVVRCRTGKPRADRAGLASIGACGRLVSRRGELFSLLRRRQARHRAGHGGGAAGALVAQPLLLALGPGPATWQAVLKVWPPLSSRRDRAGTHAAARAYVRGSASAARRSASYQSGRQARDAAREPAAWSRLRRGACGAQAAEPAARARPLGCARPHPAAGAIAGRGSRGLPS